MIKRINIYIKFSLLFIEYDYFMKQFITKKKKKVYLL